MRALRSATICARQFVLWIDLGHPHEIPFDHLNCLQDCGEPGLRGSERAPTLGTFGEILFQCGM
jgi:hypothetical protein